MLVTTSEKRQANIIDELRARRQKGSENILFLTEAGLLTENIYTDPVLLCQGQSLALASIITRRIPLLFFAHAFRMSDSGVYQLTVCTRYSEPHLPFFPMDIVNARQEVVRFQPDGFIKILKKTGITETSEALFALVLVAGGITREKLCERLVDYDVFLQSYRETITRLPQELCGILVVVRDRAKSQPLHAIARSLSLRSKIRVIALDDCCPHTIFAEPVWKTRAGNSVAMVPAESPATPNPAGLVAPELS